MATSINHIGYDRRLAVVEGILHSHGLQSTNISTLAYSEDYQYPFNNYIYKTELASLASSFLFSGTQPGTVKAPSEGVSVLVIKLSNPASGMNNTNRVENDVAVQYLVRQSVEKRGLGPLIPAVYAWAPATDLNPDAKEESFGWIISEFRDGVDLDSKFPSLEVEDKAQILDQVAAVLAAIQTTKLPDSVEKIGGLTFDPSGQIVSGEAHLLKGAPVDSYAERRVAKLRERLQEAGKSTLIQGWKENGVDARIEKFLSGGGPETLFSDMDEHYKGIIHGDFTMNNMLFDEATRKVTAILDFDWAQISHPYEEYLSLLNELGYNIRLTDDEFNMALLSGDFSTPPADMDKATSEKWEGAKAWNNAMKRNGVLLPGDIKGAAAIRDVIQFEKLLCPYGLTSKTALAKMDDEKKAELRASAERDLVLWLEKHGF